MICQDADERSGSTVYVQSVGVHVSYLFGEEGLHCRTQVDLESNFGSFRKD